MTEEEFLRNFPVGVSIPWALRELLSFQNKERADHWFGDRTRPKRTRANQTYTRSL